MTLCTISTIYSHKWNKIPEKITQNLSTSGFFFCSHASQTTRIHWLSHQLKSVHFLLLSIVVSLLSISRYSPLCRCRCLFRALRLIHRYTHWEWVCDLFADCGYLFVWFIRDVLSISLLSTSSHFNTHLWHSTDRYFLSFPFTLLIAIINFGRFVYDIPFRLCRFWENIWIFQHFQVIESNMKT